MTYDTTPVSLTTLDETKPLRTEDPGVLDVILRQTRSLLKQVMLVSHNADGTVKSAALANLVSTAALVDSSVTALKLATDAVTTAKIQDLAVTTAKLADAVVTAAKLGLLSVGTGALQAAAVTQAKIANDSVGAAQLIDDTVTDANRSVTADHIRNNSISTAKVQDLAITPGKMSNIGVDKILVGTGTGVVAVTLGGNASAVYNSGAGTLDLTFNTNISTTPYSITTEQGSSASAGGTSVVATWNQRPVGGTTAWVNEFDPQNITAIAGDKIRFLKIGTYLVRVRAWAYSVGKHVVQLRDSAGTTVLITGTPALAPAGTQSLSELVFYIAAPVANTDVTVFHYTELAQATNGMGFPMGTLGGQNPINRYVIFEVVKIG